ncbi:MAG TPA: flagellar basal body rod protein FlgB [Bacteroidota bacterium]|nr:flagellar basal body rod protein FlgB [Bacteroidota bacterium]
MKLFESTRIPLLSKALDAYTLRHKTIASNIANIESTGYKPLAVSFEDQLNASRRGAAVSTATTDPRHIAIASDEAAEVDPVVREAPSPSLSHNPSDVNSVDIDNEMAELAKNQLRFKFAARLLAGTFKDIQESIRGSE